MKMEMFKTIGSIPLELFFQDFWHYLATLKKLYVSIFFILQFGECLMQYQKDIIGKCCNQKLCFTLWGLNLLNQRIIYIGLWSHDLQLWLYNALFWSFERATKSPFYLHVGAELLDSLNRNVRTDCGFATMHSVRDRTLEDRMESFFLAETVKYLYVSMEFLGLKDDLSPDPRYLWRI